ncbi:hypothetical protein BU25DRAFT_456829 [Macroventuria anomochaeta]|uniref:Uncharacterized protein n=1 Tax=Macroventuria anomochaeta TaxID=301207 RepID=A0ACB6S8D1_9PLEO|nr:uncharacterized protein BU25DRAFT_456829 [Macroventuria anomochaeta]KAF2629772.1 hypothetical protein BU25DRAFT_456829 [Macroventuria anomochaeta]
MTSATKTEDDAGRTDGAFAFLDLPPELRMEVYEYLSLPSTRRLPLDKTDMFYSHIDLAILQVSRLTRKEATPILLHRQHLALILRLTDLATGMNLVGKTWWIAPIIWRLQDSLQEYVNGYKYLEDPCTTLITTSERMSLDQKQRLGSISDTQTFRTFFDNAVHQLCDIPVLKIHFEMNPSDMTNDLSKALRYLLEKYSEIGGNIRVKVVFAIPQYELTAPRTLLEQFSFERSIDRDGPSKALRSG